MESVEEEVEEIERICRLYDPLEVRTATDDPERERLWAGRKGVLGALGRLAPNYYLADGTIPRTRLVEVLARIKEISRESGFPIANLLHAGDGNLHPSVLFDERRPGDTERVMEIGGEILRLCVEAGGVLSGEHGIGLEKQEHMPLMFTDDDMEAMSKLKPAFATDLRFNPGKVFPHRRLMLGRPSGRRHRKGRQRSLHLGSQMAATAHGDIRQAFADAVGPENVTLDVDGYSVDGLAPSLDRWAVRPSIGFRAPCPSPQRTDWPWRRVAVAPEWR